MIIAMSTTIRNTILAQVEDRASFLEHLITELENWREVTDKEFKQIARDSSDGDSEMRENIYSSLITAFDENEYRKDMFYKSMLIMVYSYYEGIVEVLARATKSSGEIKNICKVRNIVLSDVAWKAHSKIYSVFRVLRNHLVHNSLSYPKRKKDFKTIKRISKIWPDIQCNNGYVTITGSDYIHDSLNKEKIVLKELCEKLGYTHQKVGQTNNTDYGRK